ncbi:MAG: NYN domain-containing protein [Rhodobacteraceae bacterium]|nr:NYN domain-containing protein [Paracoccaceae bacterium]
MSHGVKLPKANNPLKIVEVIKTEEKGSDVNLAVNLLNDAALDKYDCAVVVSNDSDLADAMRLVKERTNKILGLFTPGRRYPSQQLKKYADFSLNVLSKHLKNNQLPLEIPGTNFKKPREW